MSVIGRELGLSPSAIHRSLEWAEEAHLFDGRSRRVSSRALDELLAHGAGFLLPGRMRGPTRGIPTAWSAEPLASQMAQTDEEPLVWAHPEGRDRGIELEPIHPCVPAAALGDPQLHALLALVDALRVGGARVRRGSHRALSVVAERSSRHVSTALLERAASYLGPLPDEVTFLGGASVALWISDPGGAPVRATDDVDVVLGATYLELDAFAARLRARGFGEDQSVICPVPACRGPRS